MAEYLIQGETLTAISDAIRKWSNTSGQMTPIVMANTVELVYDHGYDVGYADGANSELDALYDFYVQATPTGVELWVTNYHPIYELEIRVIINNITTGRTHNEIFTIDADEGEFYWESDDEIFSSSESNTYNISVEGVRWIK